MRECARETHRTLLEHSLHRRVVDNMGAATTQVAKWGLKSVLAMGQSLTQSSPSPLRVLKSPCGPTVNRQDSGPTGSAPGQRIRAPRVATVALFKGEA